MDTKINNGSNLNTAELPSQDQQEQTTLPTPSIESTDLDVDKILTEVQQAKKDPRRNYEEKRVMRPVSFLKESDSHLLSIVGEMEYGTWVKGILSNFTNAEIAIFKANPKALIVPSVLVEKAIEDGLFDLDEYLRERGLVAVPKDSVKKSQLMAKQQGLDSFNQDFSQDFPQDFSQDFPDFDYNQDIMN